MNENVVTGDFNDQGKAFERHAHDGATDELIEDAIRLLALLEMYGQQGEEIHGPTVATAVQQVVAVLRKAQSHNRSVMPLMPAPWRQEVCLS